MIAKEHAPGAVELRKVFCNTLLDMARADARVVLLDADLMNAAGTIPFRTEFPERTFDCGVQEANMIGTAAGLSSRGFIPFAHTSGAYAKNSLTIIGSDPGITAALNGGTHMPFEDLGIMSTIPEMTVAEPCDAVSLERIVRMAKDAGVVVQEVERVRLDQVYPNHQGLLAYASSASYSTLDEIFACAGERGEAPFLILLDGITDPHNLGAIIRSAECAGAHGVVIPERRSAGLNPACVKAAAGAVEYMKVARVSNLCRAIEEIKERGVWVYAADMDGENVYEADLTGAVAIVIGAEGEGVSQLVLKNCDKTLSIPMKGHINSLNASVAAGIMLFQASRARNG